MFCSLGFHQKPFIFTVWMDKHRVPREAVVSPSLEIFKAQVDTALVAQLEQKGQTRPRQGHPPHAHLNHSVVQRTAACFRAQLPQGRWFLFNIITILMVLMPNHLNYPPRPGRARPCTNSERKILHLSSFYSLVQTKLQLNKCRTNSLHNEGSFINKSV